MISKKTVLILGAGASRNYGYPTGKELRGKILNSQSQRDYFRFIPSIFREQSQNTIEKVMHDYPNFLKFYKGTASSLSIDQFLLRTSRFRDIGKTLIFYYILKAEMESSDSGGDDDWYSILFSKMIEGLQEPGKIWLTENEISFVTFNYDRSLEDRLFSYLENTYPDSPLADRINVLNNLDIIHLYGKVFDLDWQDNKLGKKYKQKGLLKSPFMEHIDNIKIMDEEESSSAFEDAKKLIKGAEKIIFIGNGYISDNMTRLGFPQILNSNQRVFGTIKGKRSLEISGIKDTFFTGNKNVTLNGNSCTDVIRDFLI